MSTSTNSNVSGPSAPGAPKAAATSNETVWDVDTAHTIAHFKVRHMMVSHVRGNLGPVTGTVWIDEKDVTRSRVDIRIDARGVDTREAKRDEHLRSADFLDVANHPNVTFVSRSVRREGDDALKVVGDLTIRNITKPVTLEVDPLPPALDDPWGNTKRGTTARATLNRKDFGLQWNVALEAGGVVVGETVTIEIDVELSRRKA